MAREGINFTDILGAMDMALDPVTCPGLVRTDEATLQAKMQAGAPLEEIVAIKRASHFKASYVYFRRFVERPVIAVAYLYDWTDRLADVRQATIEAGATPPEALRADLAELHKGVWSAGEIPLVYVFLPTRIDIYHILQGPAESTHGIQANPWKSIELAAELSEQLQSLKDFSARKLDDGRLWEEHPDARTLKLDGAAFMALSQEIGNCRFRLVQEYGVPDDLVRRLLILFVLIKYLEERKDRNGQRVFPQGTFATFAPAAEGFVDLLRAGGSAVLNFLDYLAKKDRFNGDVFQLNATERSALLATDLAPFADLLDAKIEGGQRTFWQRYAFHELPVELISHLYEQFLPHQPGVVYTPPFLVSFILDEVLPLSDRTPDTFRLIDPACGSGVFLVGAFKRLVHRWWRDSGFKNPDVNTLKRLLRQHIFGVDIEGEAIRLTMFSLSVALCDFLEPRVIWDELHFDHLQFDNLIADDFFARYRQSVWAGPTGFDLVIGNPPFISELTAAAREVVSAIAADEPGFEVPDNQAALLFLKVATKIAKPHGHIAIIQPSGPFLYGESSVDFRRVFLQLVHVSQIVDLSHLSRVLFRRQRVRTGIGNDDPPGNPGDVAVAIVFAQNCPPLNEPLLHVTVRRTVQAEQKLMFEIDHYDLHIITRQEALDNPNIWKANFIGGGRIPRLLGRLGAIPTLGAFLEKAMSENEWDSGEGYIAGSQAKVERLQLLSSKSHLSDAETAELKNLRKRYRKAPWLTNHLMMPTESFSSNGIDWQQKKKIEEVFFAEPRRKSLFVGPLLLVKELIEEETGRLPTALLDEGIRFKGRIFGIHAPRSNLTVLKRINKMLKNEKLVHFHILATSPEYLINKSSALRAADLLNLPFPRSKSADIDLSAVDEALIDDALKHVPDFKRKGNEAAVRQEPNSDELLQFGEFFCRVLGSVYKSLRASDPVMLSGGICYPFYFGKAPSVHIDAGQAGVLKLDKILSSTVNSSMRCQRILRVFHGNMLLLIKPAQLRYWLRSIAVRDADEMFVELQRRGH